MTPTHINISDAKEQLSELASRAMQDKERIILTRRGKEIAALISIEDLHLIEHNQNQHDLHLALAALKEARLEGAISLEVLQEKIG